MNRPELYKKTVDILYEAYFNDTLEHGDCRKCAVGNIVSANLNIDPKMWVTRWDDLFCTRHGEQIIFESALGDSRVIREIQATGYNWRELAQMEGAFESAHSWCSEEDHMFNGLVAVLEVLKQIHEVDDNAEDITRFKDHYQTRTCPV